MINLKDINVCSVCQQTQLIKTPNEDNQISILCNYCGYTTSSALHKNNTDIIKLIVPYIMNYRFIDESDYIWIPFTVTLPSIGALFPVGGQFDFKWHVCIIQPMTDSERKEKGEQYTEKLRTDDPFVFGRFEFKNALEKLKEIAMSKKD